MKLKLATLIVIATSSLFAQTNKPSFVRGTIDIKYNTRILSDSNGKPNKGIPDIYKLNVNISDSAIFRGTISHFPLLMGGLVVNSVQQPSSLNYDMECDVVNPNNPAQTRNVGRVYGLVPIDVNGVYRFNDGTLKVGVYQIGTARGFESKFTGLAAGKPIIKKEGFFDKLKKEALNISKQVNGKTVTVIVKKYDKMTFQSHTFAAGPVQIYGEATVNGEMIYDYDRYAWYFQNVGISYVVDGKQMVDKLTGNIRWVESPNRKSNGEGEYQFDIRVNEPPPSESAIFAGASDESAFFQTDNTIPALTGAMKYKDSMQNQNVTASMVQIDLVGNKLSKQQVMNLAKLLILSSIVPINAE